MTDEEPAETATVDRVDLSTRDEVLLARLAEAPATPGELALALDAPLEEVSGRLAALRDAGLVDRTNWSTCTLEERGREVLERHRERV